MGIKEYINNPLGMTGNYDERMVGRDDVNGITISTCWTTDEGFETAIQDGGPWIIVERYTNQILAAGGHEKWIGEIRNKIKVVPDLGWSDIPGMDTTRKLNYLDEDGN